MFKPRNLQNDPMEQVSKPNTCTECGEAQLPPHHNWPSLPPHLFHEIHELYRLSDEHQQCHICYCQDMAAKPVTALKDYRCLYCKNQINKGSRYIMYIARHALIHMHICMDCVPEKPLEYPVADWKVRPNVDSIPEQVTTQDEIDKVHERLWESGIHSPRSYDAANRNPKLVSEIIDQAVIKKLLPYQLHRVIMWAMGWEWR